MPAAVARSVSTEASTQCDRRQRDPCQREVLARKTKFHLASLNLLAGSHGMKFRISGENAQPNNGIASAACHVRQSLHGGALIVRGKMRVLSRDCRALVPYNLARDKVRDTRCF